MGFNRVVGCKSLKLSGNKSAGKKQLVASLLSHLCPGDNEIIELFTLESDHQGCPTLKSPLPLTLNVSFSYCDDSLWGAIALNYPLGLDVESIESFSNNYPLDLIFTEDEQRRLSQFSSCIKSAATAMWTCKEAVVKSRKSGFSNIKPKDVLIGSIRPAGDFFQVEVFAGNTYATRVTRQGHLWRAIAGPAH